TQPPPERIEPEAERLERHHAEQASVTAPAEDDGSGPAAIADLVAHVPHLAADALAVREAEHLRLLWLDAYPPEHTRGHHGVDGPGVDDHVDVGEPAGIGQVHQAHPHLDHPQATFRPAQPPSCRKERHAAIPSPAVLRRQSPRTGPGMTQHGSVAVRRPQTATLREAPGSVGRREGDDESGAASTAESYGSCLGATRGRANSCSSGTPNMGAIRSLRGRYCPQSTRPARRLATTRSNSPLASIP